MLKAISHKKNLLEFIIFLYNDASSLPASIQAFIWSTSRVNICYTSVAQFFFCLVMNCSVKLKPFLRKKKKNFFFLGHFIKRMWMKEKKFVSFFSFLNSLKDICCIDYIVDYFAVGFVFFFFFIFFFLANIMCKYEFATIWFKN